MTIIWCMVPMIWSVTDTTFCRVRPFFALIPPQQHKKSKFRKNEKKPGDVVTLHMFTINDNHMIYGSWDMECDGHNFLLFWIIFHPFTLPLTTCKIKILKKWKKKNPQKTRYIIILHMSSINDIYMMYVSWDVGMMDTTFCHFKPCFALITL